jgi:hypothetical protein
MHAMTESVMFHPEAIEPFRSNTQNTITVLP